MFIQNTGGSISVLIEQNWMFKGSRIVCSSKVGKSDLNQHFIPLITWLRIANLCTQTSST